jgi:phosphoribosylformylglycinamidine (FGAM) synthase PurS component
VSKAKLRYYEIRLTILPNKAHSPPDETVLNVLKQMGYVDMTRLSLGRYLEIEVVDGESPDVWRERIEAVCRNGLVNLVNPVIESWKITIEP